MALSNATGAMVLSTGNKSEMAVGYATLYGDMCGGFNVLKDLYKMEVYALSRWRNENIPLGSLAPEGAKIPENIFTKAPTAELKDNQTDQDTLPLQGTRRYPRRPDRERARRGRNRRPRPRPETVLKV